MLLQARPIALTSVARTHFFVLFKGKLTVLLPLFQFGFQRIIKGTVSPTAHAQLIIPKWSDVFKFAICETRWRQQAKDRILTVTEAVETTLAVRRFQIRAVARNVDGRSREEEFGWKKCLQVVVTGVRGEFYTVV